VTVYASAALCARMRQSAASGNVRPPIGRGVAAGSTAVVVYLLRATPARTARPLPNMSQVEGSGMPDSLTVTASNFAER